MHGHGFRGAHAGRIDNPERAVIDRIEMKLAGLDSVKTAELKSGVVTKADGAANRLLEDDYELL